jgi:hypothetical protein
MHAKQALYHIATSPEPHHEFIKEMKVRIFDLIEDENEIISCFMRMYKCAPIGTMI